MTIVLTRREGKRGTFKRIKIVTDIGVRLPQAKECLGLQITGKEKKK